MTDPGAKPRRTRVLLITGDAIGPKLAGPGVRALEMAKAIADTADVRVISFSTVEPTGTPFEVFAIVAGSDADFRPHERWADVIVFQGTAMAQFRSLRQSRKILVFDAYIPITLELLEINKERDPDSMELWLADATNWLNLQLRRADLVLVASERQRLYWIGQLMALGRVNPRTFHDDPALDRLVRIVPFGLAATPPVHERPALRGVHPAIGTDDKLLVWGGGLYNWFDPFTLIRAVAALTKHRPEVKLYFLGTKSPTPEVPEMRIVSDARALATELGVYGTNVIFNDSWVDFDDRQNYFLEADLGVSTHPAGIETTFSFRTRILDYLWAGLPMVVTAGDHFGDLIERERLGLTVPPGEADALAAALERALYDSDFTADAAANVRRIAPQYVWSAALRPLVDFLNAPQRAADSPTAGRAAYGRPRRWTMLQSIMTTWRLGGLAAVSQKVARRLGRQS